MEPGGDRNEAAAPAAPTPDVLVLPPPPDVARDRPGVAPAFRSRGLEMPGVDGTLPAALVPVAAPPSPPPTGNPPVAGVAGVVGVGAGAGVPPPNVGADEAKEKVTPLVALDAAAAAVVLPGVWTPGVVAAAAAAAGAAGAAADAGVEEPKAGAGELKLKDISTHVMLR